MSEKFQPKAPVQLDPPKDDPISVEELSQYDGERSSKMYIAIKGTIFDVSSNTNAYGVGKGYHVLVGRDASRALGKSSLDAADTDPSVSYDYSSLDERQLKVLNDWYTFFSNRYNVVGKVAGLPEIGKK